MTRAAPSPAPEAPGAGPPPPLAAGPLLGVAAAAFALHLAALTRYGWFRDELYYAASTSRLDWGYVDHPPLSIAVLALVRAVGGDGLAPIRLAAALAGAATVFLTGALARRLGGGAFAQALAALGVALAPVVLGVSHIYSMNALDLVLWAAALLALLGAMERGTTGRWAALGVVLGVGLLNKISVLWLGAGIAAALLATPHRRALATPGPWLAALVAAALFAPYVAWNAAHGWPTLEFMANARQHKMTTLEPARFLLDQVLHMNPAAAPVWLVGLAAGLAGRVGAGGRAFAVVWLATLAILLASGSARASYLAPAYAGLWAAGAVALERATARRGRAALVTAVALAGLAAAPLALPLLPVEAFVRFQRALGLAPRTEERHAMGALPQHYADMHGWEEMVALVAEAHARLSPEERARCRVFGQNYGEAGAVDVLGRRLGLPRAISGHNSYWLWGPGAGEPEAIIAIGGDREGNARFFEEIEIVGRTASPWSMPYERGLDVWIGRRPKVSLREAWPALRRYI
uniref:Glycosyltransferase RgtA/B/C/D-like domain-containing protein n=1 Tax=Eiseniibacteriota bacterium TaxID=2212470 RepID=A0A832MJ55_UNCEI